MRGQLLHERAGQGMLTHVVEGRVVDHVVGVTRPQRRWCINYQTIEKSWFFNIRVLTNALIVLSYGAIYAPTSLRSTPPEMCIVRPLIRIASHHASPGSAFGTHATSAHEGWAAPRQIHQSSRNYL